MSDHHEAPAPPAAPSRSGSASRHPLVIAALVLAALVVIGAFLPWASVLNLDINGVEADGKLTLILAIVGGGALLVARGRMWGLITMLIASALVTLIAFVDLNDVEGFADQVGLVDTGSGLWLTTIAGVAWLVVTIVLLVRRDQVWAPAPEAASARTGE
jgi:hypothetical protein